MTQNFWDATKIVLREKFIKQHNPIIRKRKTSSRQPNFEPKTTGKRRTKKPKFPRRKEIIKIRAEIIEKKNERNNNKV